MVHRALRREENAALGRKAARLEMRHGFGARREPEEGGESAIADYRRRVLDAAPGSRWS